MRKIVIFYIQLLRMKDNGVGYTIDNNIIIILLIIIIECKSWPKNIGNCRYHMKFPWEPRVLEDEVSVMEEIQSESRKTVLKKLSSQYLSVATLGSLYCINFSPSMVLMSSMILWITFTTTYPLMSSKTKLTDLSWNWNIELQTSRTTYATNALVTSV